MRPRDLIFGALAVVLLIGYIVLGDRLKPIVTAGAAATPTPAKPTGPVSAPQVRGRIAFVLRGDVYVLSGGNYQQLSFDGRSQQPALTRDGATLYFSRFEEIEGDRVVDGQLTPARLGFSDVVRRPTASGSEDVLLSGLTRAPGSSRQHTVRWFLGPAPSPDGTKLALIEGDADGSADLVLFDLAAKRVTAILSTGADWADPAWAPDGKSLVLTSYDHGDPELILKPVDGRASTAVKGVPEGEPYRPSFSPDGRWIVYTLRHDDGRMNDVHALELASGRDLVLTADGRSWNAVFSPDGTQIAFLRADGFTIDLWVMDVGAALAGGAAKQPMRITHSEGIDGASRPAWAN